jgi:DNA replication protein DnaC
MSFAQRITSIKDEIAEKVGDRITSRIAGMCKIVEIKGRDRRIGG